LAGIAVAGIAGFEPAAAGREEAGQIGVGMSLDDRAWTL
jgi:hypothetical protein